MMQRICGWGVVLLIVPIFGCGSGGDANSSADADSDAASVDASAEPQDGEAQPVAVRPTVDVETPPQFPASPIELPKPPVDEALRKRIAQLYSPQIQQVIAEARSISSATRPGKSPVEIRLEVQQKLSEADRLRADSVEYLRAQGQDVFEKLKGAMLDESPEVRRGAAWYLFERLDRNDEQMVAVFVQALQDDDRTVRQMALAGVKGLPPESLVQFLPQLIALLERGQEDDADRAAIAQLIGRLKTQASVALPVLLRLGHEDANGDVRLKCLYAASQITSDDKAVEIFRTALSDPATEVRRMAALRLGKLAPSAVAAAGDLAKTLKDEDPKVREYTAVSLGQLGDGAAGAVNPLIAALDDPTPEVRRAAVAALSQLGPTARQAIGPLQKRLDDPDPKTRELAQIAIEVLQSTPSP